MKSALLCLFLTVLCSLRAIQLFLASTSELRASNHHSWFPSSKKTLKEPLENDKLKNDSFVLDSKPNNVFYFVQITDLHLSRYRPKGHTHFFLHFVQSILPVVSPKFVVVTGDLTDAKDNKRITSQQYADEWRVYQSAIQEKVGVGWYDVRGNHDCFDLPSWKSRVNYYRTHGYSAGLVEQGKGIYSWQVEQPDSTYQFVAIDACPKRGPSRPLNFFGYLTSNTMDQLEKALTSQPYNHTFVFSHYPTTSMVFGVSNKGSSFRDLARHYSAYFCGHLHKLIAGLGETLQSYDPVTKSLELELGDMKEHGLYRVVAVDHDLISFTDIQLPLDRIPARAPLNSAGLVYPMENDRIIWPDPVDPAPSVLVTNPKDARYSIPSKEPLWRIRQSSHIRFLVFSSVPHSELAVNVTIDGQPHLYPATFSGDTNTPMWTVPWNTSLYDHRKTHTLTVTVTQPDGKTGSSKIPFRLDTHRTKVNGGSGEFIIKSHMAKTLQFIAMSSVISMLFCLLVPKFYMQRADAKEMLERLLLRIHTIDQTQIKTRYARLQKQILIWSLRLLQLPKDQPIVWHATLFYILSLLCLPWFRADFIPSGETAHERYGTFYIWGIVFGKEWVPIADTWMFAAEQIVFDVLVFLFLVTWRGTDASDLKCRGLQVNDRRQLNERAWFKGLETIFWLWRTSEIIALSSFYGGIWPTLILNTLTFWMLFVGGVLAWGKNGVFTKKNKRTRLMPLVPGCTACQQEDLYAKPPLLHHQLVDEKMAAAAGAATLTQEEEQKLDSVGTSSSSSSTPFDGNPSVKSRKKSKK